MRSDGPAEAREGGGSQTARFPRGWRRVFAVLAWLALAAVLGTAVGFVWFVDHLPREESAAVRNADGIVVLTGRAARIGDAIELLAAKRGRRLLISGVYPRTTAAAIARLKPEHRFWVACCVDLDHSAVNTIGNAIQTRKWAKQHGFKSLIVVTSNYHMPRALTEIAYQLPDVELIAFPITPERVRTESWGDRFVTARLLFIEYLKYLRTMIRTRLSQLLSAPNA
jgi:uncharacterized SAM-binding protein YcdF (DUF218 family)